MPSPTGKKVYVVEITTVKKCLVEAWSKAAVRAGEYNVLKEGKEVEDRIGRITKYDHDKHLEMFVEEDE